MTWFREMSGKGGVSGKVNKRKTQLHYKNITMKLVILYTGGKQWDCL